MPDARDLAALLVDTIRDLSEARGERDSYRRLAQQAIHRLHEQHLELTRLRERYHRLLDDRRREAA